MEVDELPGIGKVTKQKLNDVGIYDTRQILTASPSDLSELTGMDLNSVRALVLKSRKKLEESNEIPSMFRTAQAMVDSNTDNLEFITTGTECMDQILGGGIETGAVTEFFGKDGAGKTQMCYTMAVRVQLPIDKGGLGAKAFWLDTEGTFKPNRILDVAEPYDLENVLENIIISHAHNSADQQIIIEQLERKIEEENVKLIIIDSAVGLFRNEYIGRANLSNRQGRITKFMSNVSKLAQNHNVAIIITNQVMVNPGMMFGDPVLPIGGTALGHTSTYRIYLQKRGKKHYAVMVKSHRHPDMEMRFDLGKTGIMDPEE